MADSESLEHRPNEIDRDSLVANEYESGYRMRLEGEAEFRTATPSWRAGWQDADRELRRSGYTLRNSTSEAPLAEPWSLYGTGRQARACELPFDVNRGEAWKRSRVEADIALGFAKRRRLS